MTILSHTEKHLGEIARAWSDKGSASGLQVVSFKEVPDENVTTFVSLGLSNEVLILANAKEIRQELVLSTYSLAIPDMIVSLVFSLCEAIAARGKAVLRGEVIPLAQGVSARIGFEAIYCIIPVFFNEEFCAYGNTSPPTVFVWVFPIHQREADYIAANGWESFEDLLEESNPDLFSIKRESVV